ncbi:MAG: twin-arginine translocase TatA/TatE family subunit [Planctomycetales bacterium]|nr:twin-arginine translocase TatA/TatE family subunit [Planctomycetales bacterium]
MLFGLGDFNVLAFGMPGGWEMIVILVIVVLLFGTRIPSVMRSMGQGVSEFKKGMQDTDEEPAGDAHK